MAGKTKKHGFRTVLSVFAFVIFASAFLMVCMQKTRSLKADAAELDRQIAVLEQQLEGEKMRAIESQVQQRYYSSDAYKEQEARDRFNLIREGDRLYIFE